MTKHMEKKTYNDQNTYRQRINHSNIALEITGGVNNENLTGSDSLNSNLDSINRVHISPVPKPFKEKVVDWLKENWVLAVILPLIGWLCVSIINLKINYARCDERIVAIKEDIESINDDTVYKELLEIQIEYIEKEIDSITIDYDDINNRLLVIEKQLEIIP